MDIDYKKQGKRNRAMGRDTEKRTRIDLIEDGWSVSKWNNNVKDNELVVVRNMFLGKGKPTMLGAGFPDFIAFRLKGENYEVIGVEVKTDGYLSSVEQEKCKWLLDNKVFGKILIASRDKDILSGQIEIKYKEFKEKKNGK